jgi:hypothetical protein
LIFIMALCGGADPARMRRQATVASSGQCTSRSDLHERLVIIGLAAAVVPDGVEEALAEVWARTHGVLERRVATIERATEELAKSPADSACVEAGRVEAHRLAGVLGTFGLSHGTELARELEEHLGRAGAGDDAQHLARLARDLRAVVEGGQAR